MISPKDVDALSFAAAMRVDGKMESFREKRVVRKGAVLHDHKRGLQLLECRKEALRKLLAEHVVALRLRDSLPGRNLLARLLDGLGRIPGRHAAPEAPERLDPGGQHLVSEI